MIELHVGRWPVYIPRFRSPVAFVTPSISRASQSHRPLERLNFCGWREKLDKSMLSSWMCKLFPTMNIFNPFGGNLWGVFRYFSNPFMWAVTHMNELLFNSINSAGSEGTSFLLIVHWSQQLYWCKKQEWNLYRSFALIVMMFSCRLLKTTSGCEFDSYRQMVRNLLQKSSEKFPTSKT